MESMSRDEARQVIVNAHLGTTAFDASDVLRKERVIQLDGLSRVEKSHRLTCAARLGAMEPIAEVDRLLWSDGQAVSFETYTHAACLFPIDDWPLLDLARQKARARKDAPSPGAMDAVLEVVADCPNGATRRQLETSTDRSEGWGWSDRKRAAEHLVWRGELICSTRRSGRRVYDLPQRRLPESILRQKPTQDEILERLVHAALAVLGVVTADDITHHYNLDLESVLRGIELTKAVPVQVEGWDTRAYALPDADTTKRSHAPRLIGPFDNLLRNRARALRVFDFDYTFEAYKPARSRVYGPYAMVVLDQNRFIGRVDAQRIGKDLSFLEIFPEPIEDPGKVTDAAKSAGETLATQLGGALEFSVSVSERAISGLTDAATGRMSD